MQEPIVRTPMYYESSGYAKDHNELDMFRNSHWANCACKDEIESAISRNFDGMHLQKDTVLQHTTYCVVKRSGPTGNTNHF